MGMNRLGFAEAVWFKLCGHGWRVQHEMVSISGFGWRSITDGLQEALVVEPVHPFERG